MSARFRARRRAVNGVVSRAAAWANGRPDVPAVAVVGSYAYGRPRMGSDVDLVLLTSRVTDHLAGAGAALPLDAGTAKVLFDGCKIVVDDGTITTALESISRPVAHWQPLT